MANTDKVVAARQLCGTVEERGAAMRAAYKDAPCEKNTAASCTKDDAEQEKDIRERPWYKVVDEDGWVARWKKYKYNLNGLNCVDDFNGLSKDGLHCCTKECLAYYYEGFGTWVYLVDIPKDAKITVVNDNPDKLEYIAASAMLLLERNRWPLFSLDTLMMLGLPLNANLITGALRYERLDFLNTLVRQNMVWRLQGIAGILCTSYGKAAMEWLLRNFKHIATKVIVYGGDLACVNDPSMSEWWQENVHRVEEILNVYFFPKYEW